MVEASGGQAGIDHALAAEFDAIVCDLMMPGRDGVAVHDELTRRRPALATRMVFITGGAVSPAHARVRRSPGRQRAAQAVLGRRAGGDARAAHRDAAARLSPGEV
ncbi:MAG: hypothetical protein IPL61_32730 [Myxococcales bacterium]|nr:hypothetical protein [Myxococcales bacterium]